MGAIASLPKIRIARSAKLKRPLINVNDLQSIKAHRAFVILGFGRLRSMN
jgi:hypothetical protein